MNTQNTEVKKLVRPLSDRKIAGVAAGIAQYFSLDVVLVRLLLAFFIIVTGFFPGVILYIVAWAIMPDGK